MLLAVQPGQSEAAFPAKLRPFAAGVFAACMGLVEVMELERRIRLTSMAYDRGSGLS